MSSLKYVNHINEEIDLSSEWYLQNGDNLQSWQRSRTSLNGKTIAITPLAQQKTFALAMSSRESNGLLLRDKLYDIVSVDADECKPGKLYMDDWYVTGYVSQSSISLHQYAQDVAMFDFVFESDDPYWTCEHHFSSGDATNLGLDYPHDYPHDFGNALTRIEINNPDVVPSKFKLIIQKQCSNPSITIGNNNYQVDVNLEDGELLVIDTMTDGTKKTITKKSSSGVGTNVFRYRHGIQRKGSGSYIFEPIPSGISLVNWDGTFAWDLTIYERRLQRRWA